MTLIKWTKEYLRIAKHNRRLILIGMFLIPILVAACTFYWSRHIFLYDRVICFADAVVCFAQFTYPLTIGIFSVYFTIHMIQNDLSISVILRRKRRGSIWLGQVYKAALTSFFITSYTTLCLFAVGKLLCRDWINWGSQDSYFYKMFDVTAPNATFGQVLFYFFTSSFLMIILANLVVLLINWVTGHQMLGWISVIILFVVDITGIGYPPVFLFYPRFALTFSKWCTDRAIAADLIYPVVLMLLFTGIGMLRSRRKDFLDVTQKQVR